MCICLILGCQSSTEYRRDKAAEDIRTLSSSLIYYKDLRTNLCFAGFGMGWNYSTLTNVPCTPEVEKNIKTFSSTQPN